MSAAADQEDLLLETRKLLNALNAENAELKNRNRQLTQRVRDAEDATLEAKRSERDLERDSKQLNFNLMQQVQARTDEAKAALAREEAALAKSRDTARALEQCQDKLGDVEARYKVAQEQIRMMEQRLEAVRSDVARTENDSVRARSELAASIALEREKIAAESKQLSSQLSTVKEENVRLACRVTELETALDDRMREIDVMRQSHQAEVTRLRAAAQRTLDAESESTFAHDQLLGIADQMLYEYDGYIDGVRQALKAIQENDACVASALARVHENRSLLHYLRESDETLQDVLRRTTEEMHTTVAEGKAGLDRVGHELHSARLDVKRAVARAEEAERLVELLKADAEAGRRELSDLNAAQSEQARYTAHLKKEIDRLEGMLSGVKAERQDAVEASSQLAEQIHSLESKLRQERLSFQDAQRQLEHRLQEVTEESKRQMRHHAKEVRMLRDDNDQLRKELQTHRQSLAAELQRIQGSLSAPPSREGSLRPREAEASRSPARRPTSPTRIEQYTLSPDSPAASSYRPQPTANTAPAVPQRSHGRALPPSNGPGSSTSAATSLAHKILSTVHLDY